MQTEELQIPASEETGRLGVMHLKRFWARTLAIRQGHIKQNAFTNEWNFDTSLFHLLGLGLEQTIGYIYTEAPSWDEFENWVGEVNGGSLAVEKIKAFNAIIKGEEATHLTAPDEPDVLTTADLEFWDKNGYIIVREAVPVEDCVAAIKAIEDFLGIDVNAPQTWYNIHKDRQGIMVQLFQHPALEKNRRSFRIRRAFEQLWGRKDLLVNTDRAGFNPPETAKWKFPGPRLHWDVSLALPIPLGTQGILYLSDTQPNQGAFTLVPGFQHRVAEWLDSLPEGANPRFQNLDKLGAIPIAANAGDFIIWHQALPHGSSPNTSSQPRIVQYINYAPAVVEVREVWI